MITMPNSKTVGVKIIDSEGKSTFVDLTKIIAETAPSLTQPDWIDYAVNTKTRSIDTFADYQLKYTIKNEPLVLYQNGKYVIRPEEIVAKTPEVTLAQFAPTKIADILKLEGIDIQSKNFPNALANQTIIFKNSVTERNKQIVANNLCYYADEFQKKLIAQTSTATSFATGAHVEKKSNLTSEEAYKQLVDVKSIFSKIGKSNAKTLIDKNYKIASTQNVANLFVLISPEFLLKILEKQGVISSTPGLEIYKNFNIELLAGIYIKQTVDLPDGVNFIAFNTGECGNILNIDVMGGYHFEVKNGRFGAQELEQSKSQIVEIAHTQTIFVSTDENVNFTLESWKNAGKRIQITEEYNDGLLSTTKTKFQDLKDNISEKLARTSNSEKVGKPE